MFNCCKPADFFSFKYCILKFNKRLEEGIKHLFTIGNVITKSSLQFSGRSCAGANMELSLAPGQRTMETDVKGGESGSPEGLQSHLLLLIRNTQTLGHKAGLSIRGERDTGPCKDAGLCKGWQRERARTHYTALSPTCLLAVPWSRESSPGKVQLPMPFLTIFLQVHVTLLNSPPLIPNAISCECSQ